MQYKKFKKVMLAKQKSIDIASKDLREFKGYTGSREYTLLRQKSRNLYNEICKLMDESPLDFIQQYADEVIYKEIESGKLPTTQLDMVAS